MTDEIGDMLDKYVWTDWQSSQPCSASPSRFLRSYAMYSCKRAVCTIGFGSSNNHLRMDHNAQCWAA